MAFSMSLSLCAFPNNGRLVSESLIERINACGSGGVLALDPAVLFLAEGDVPLGSMLLEPPLAVRTLDVFRVWS